jgi:WD40-like Beta Propeller Repeat/PDZ domain
MGAARAESDRRIMGRIRRVLAWLAALLILSVTFLFFFGERLLSEFLISDGESQLESADWKTGMRFAWQERGRISRPDEEARAENTEGSEFIPDRRRLLDERGATLDPRSGDLIFARRAAEQGWDLFRARWSPRGWREPESLFELNSTSDDLDPRFSPDGAALWFASRRAGGQGGFDLWRAWRSDEGFAAPENLGPRLNGPQDERHPAPGASRLVLASNRLAADATRYELFEARPAVDEMGRSLGDWDRPELISELAIDGAAETRSPALSADGRFLYFASDRAGGRGGFDLWRSLRFEGRWRQPQALEALNTPADELDPSLSREGMTLVFARRRAEDPAALACALHLAERREMMQLRQPGDAPWRRLLTILAAVLVVLLLTLLALKWQSLHPFVKFLILSIILHLLFLIFAKPPEDLGLGQGDGGDQAFAVTFLPSETSAEAPSGRAARGDRVSAERQATASAAAKAQAQARDLNDAPALRDGAPAAAAPSRAATALAESASALAAPERASRQAAVAENRTASRRGAPASASVAKRSAPAPQVSEAAARAQGLAPASAEPLANAGVKVAPRSAAESAPSGRDAPSAPRSQPLAGRRAADAMGESSADVSVPSVAEGDAAARRGVSAPSPAVAKTGVASGKKVGADPQAGELAGAARLLEGPSAADAARAKAIEGGSPLARGERAEVESDLDLKPRDLSLAGEGEGRSRSGREGLAESSRDLAALEPLGRRGRARQLGEVPSASSEGRAKRRAEATAGGETTFGEASSLATDSRRRGEVGASVRTFGDRPLAASPAEGFGPRDLVAPRAGGDLDERPVAQRGDAFSSRRRRPRLGGRGPSASNRRGRAGRGEEVTDSGTPGSRGEAREGESSEGRSARRLDVAPRRAPAMLASLTQGLRARGENERPVDLAPRDLLRRRAASLGQEMAQGEAPDIYARRRGQARLEALEAAGGTAETEAAVLSGLRYLKSTQRKGGPWGTGRRDDKYGDLRAGKTGLALLAFLGSGYTHQREGEFQETVRQGIDYLLRVQDRRNGHIGQGSAYGHGIATYALAEAYAMTRDEDLRQALWRATQRILSAQVKSRRNRLDGAWSYYYANEDRSFDRWPRMSVTVWQVMALESARIGGIRVPDDALKRARGHVSRAWDGEREAFRYNHDPDWVGNRYPILPGSSAAAVFALQLLGGEQNAADREHIRAGLDFCLERSPRFRWRKPSQDNFVFRGQGNEYFLYYATLALRMQGGADWRAWNDRLKPLLLDNQSEDGSWRPISYYADYAQDTNRDRSYTTSMCVLMLEAYYRYDTPLLKKLARELTDEPATPTSEVIVDSLDENSAAARVRLRVGDVILELDGIAVPTIAELERVNDTLEDDDRPRIKIRRGDRDLILRGRGALAGLTVREEDL